MNRVFFSCEKRHELGTARITIILFLLMIAWGLEVAQCKNVLAFDTLSGTPASSMVFGVEPVDEYPYGMSYSFEISVEVQQKRLTVRQNPTNKSKRRGVVVRGAKLPLLDKQPGPGCNGHLWYKIHENSWVCGRYVVVRNESPVADSQPVVGADQLTPWPYAFVHQPAMEYEYSQGVFQEVREVFKGYGFAVERIVTIDGERYYRSVEGRHIPTYAAGITRRVSEYEGIVIQEGEPWPVGWVNSKNAFAYRSPSKQKKFRLGTVARFTPFKVLEQTGTGKKAFYRFDENAWLSARDVRVVTTAPRPSSVGEMERWIDVDVAQQIITAYQGDRPVYATMVSTGRAGGSRTVKGEFRIWVKVSAIPMDNTDEELDLESDTEEPDTDSERGDRRLFSLHDVPWTQFFFENYALHGVYWHNRFGNRKSHGCVNLAPRDAKWFFNWTYPQLPDGWWAIHSVAGEEATLVRVR